MDYVSLNGKVVLASNGLISHQDRGFLLGDGFFTTIKCLKAATVCFDAHYQRLRDTAETFSMHFSYQQADLSRFIDELINANHSMNQDLAIRITMTRGVGARGIGFDVALPPTLLITLSELPAYPESLKCKISSFKRSSIRPLCNVKHVGYQTSILAYHEAIQDGFDDAILLNENSDIVCTSRANIFFIKNDCLITPPLTDGCLPGIARGKVLKGLPNIRCESVKMNDLENFQAAFVTNSLCGVIPISHINQHAFDVQNNLIKLAAQLLACHQGL